MLKRQVLRRKHSAHSCSCFLSVPKALSSNSQDSSVACKQWSEVEFGAWRLECPGGLITSRSTTLRQTHQAASVPRIEVTKGVRFYSNLCSLRMFCFDSLSDTLYCRIVLAYGMTLNNELERGLEGSSDSLIESLSWHYSRQMDGRTETTTILIRVRRCREGVP
jgi:hypothetical protein